MAWGALKDGFNGGTARIQAAEVSLVGARSLAVRGPGEAGETDFLRSLFMAAKPASSAAERDNTVEMDAQL